MEGFSRDLLCGIGKGDAPPPEQRPGQLREEEEEVDLRLGLSLGGRFGLDSKSTSDGPHLAWLPAGGSPSCASSEGDVQRQRLQGTAVTKEPSSSSSVLLPLSLAPRTATLGPRGDQSILGASAAARANSMGHVERRLMEDMPSVFTKGLPNGNRVEGFLYKYRKGEDVKIVCICHGSFLTPSEFVEHAGAGKVDNLLRHIVVSTTPTL